MDFPNASAQDKFIIMLQERLDKLSDELQDSGMNNPMNIHPNTKTCTNLICFDIGCIASATFIKISNIQQEEFISQIIDIVNKYQYLEAFTYHSSDFILQLLVCFKHSIVASRIGVEICKTFPLITVELQPIYDFHGSINQDEGLFTYYYYNIVALQENTLPDIISDRDVKWIKFDGTRIDFLFMGNVEGSDGNYNDIIKKMETNNVIISVWPHNYLDSE